MSTNRIDYVSRVAQAVQLDILPPESLYGYSYTRDGGRWLGLLEFEFDGKSYSFTDVANSQQLVKWQICEKICRHFHVGDIAKKNAARNQLFESGHKIRIEKLDWGLDGVTATIHLYHVATSTEILQQRICAANLHAFGEAVKSTAWKFITAKPTD